MSTEFELLEGRFKALIAVIDNAHDKVQDGVILDLSSLDQEAAALCAGIERVTALQARQLQPYIADMITKLESLEVSLQDFQRQHGGKDS